MAKYGSFKYSEQTYGHLGDYPTTIIWIVQVDWDGDGTLEGYNEGNYLKNCNLSMGRQEYLNADGSGFEHMRVGKATLVFENYDNRYDPRNTSSPLYPNIKPGKRIQIGIFDADYQLVQFTGLIDSIVPRGYKNEVIITCVDYMQGLTDQELTYDAELFNTTVTGAINHQLTQAQYPGGRLLDDETQPVWVAAVSKQKAGGVIHQMADAGLGIFWIDELGRARYQKRDHSETHLYIFQVSILKDIIRAQPWDGLYNDIAVTSRRFIKLQPAIIFTLPEAIYIANGNNETIEINYEPSTDIQIKSVTGNTQVDDNGAALTMTASSISLGLTGGTIIVSNNSGSNGYLIDIAIRGRKYASTEQIFTASDATSQATYGIRKFRLDSPFLQDRNFANAFATILKDFLKDDRESLIIQFRGRPTAQYYFPIMTTVEFYSETLGINGEVFQVLGLEHDWINENGQDVLTTLYLHKTLADDTAISPSSLETAPKVREAPSGYEDPGGDQETMAGVNTVAVYHNGAFVGNASELNFVDG